MLSLVTIKTKHSLKTFKPNTSTFNKVASRTTFFPVGSYCEILSSLWTEAGQHGFCKTSEEPLLMVQVMWFPQAKLHRKLYLSSLFPLPFPGIKQWTYTIPCTVSPYWNAFYISHHLHGTCLTCVCPYSGLWLRWEKEWVTDICYNMHETQRH